MLSLRFIKRATFTKNDFLWFGCLLAWGLNLTFMKVQAEERFSYLSEYSARSESEKAILGEKLFQDLNCGQCHQEIDQKKILSRSTAPNILVRALQLDPHYISKFLEKKGSDWKLNRMPEIRALDDPEKKEELTHFLTELFLPAHKTEKAERPKAKLEKIEHGRTLFHTIGCLACHSPEKGVQPEGVDSQVELKKTLSTGRPLEILNEKYTFNGLSDFLQNPDNNSAYFRMPKFPLSRSESEALAHYLLRDRTPTLKSFSIDREKSKKGKEHFLNLGCQNCHLSPSQGPQLKSLPLSSQSLERGCLSNPKTAKSFNFHLNPQESEALKAFLKSFTQVKASDPKSKLRLETARLGCLKCHQRDGQGGPNEIIASYFSSQASEEDLGDEGRFPPPLTGVGAKILPKVLPDILQGKKTLRPYLKTRMPSFGNHDAKKLASLFVQADQHLLKPEPERAGRNARGRHLVGSKGMSCITCHTLNGKKSLGIPGLDLGQLSDRLQPQWFRRFLVSPAAYRSQTRMPAFFDIELDDKTLLPLKPIPTSVFRDLDSIWVYLMESGHTRLPVGLEKTNAFELEPKKKPIVFRTFLKGSGLHAIAVGHPENIHYAFDAKNCRLAIAWKGKFLDAEATWEDRFTPLSIPLGKKILTVPMEPLLAKLPQPTSPWPSIPKGHKFKGYKIDKQGFPVFQYTWDEFTVSNSIKPLPSQSKKKQGFVQTISLSTSVERAKRPPIYLKEPQSPPIQIIEILFDGLPVKGFYSDNKRRITPPLSFEKRLSVKLEVTW